VRALVAAAVLLAATPDVASAAACCVGSTSSEFGRLGPCDTLSVGAAWSLEAHVGSWTLDGDLASGGDTRRLIHTWTGALGVRPVRPLQLGVAMPLVVQGRRIGDLEEVGGGPGDLRAWAWVEPFEDLPGEDAAPFPEVGLSFVFPTGIPTEVAGGLGAGATGAGWFSVGPGFRLGRTLVKGALHGSGSILFSAPRPGDTKRVVPGAAWSLSFTGSVFLPPRTILGIVGGASGRTPGLVGDRWAGVASVEPWVGVSWTIRARGWDRVAFGLRGSLPIPKLGRSNDATVTFVVAVNHVRRGALGPIGAGG